MQEFSREIHQQLERKGYYFFVSRDEGPVDVTITPFKTATEALSFISKTDTAQLMHPETVESAADGDEFVTFYIEGAE